MPDISRAILHVTESEKMVEIEKAWFDQKTCQNSSIPVSSSSLSIDSFSGLFLIAGGASFLALIIFLVKFLYEHRHILTSSDTGNSIRNRIALLARRFDRKDLSSHTFKKSEPREGNGIELVEASPCTNFAQSPSSFSCHTEGNFISYEEHVTSPTDYCDPNSTCQTPDRMGTSTKYTNNPTQESPEAK